MRTAERSGGGGISLAHARLDEEEDTGDSDRGDPTAVASSFPDDIMLNKQQTPGWFRGRLARVVNPKPQPWPQPEGVPNPTREKL